MSAGVSSGCHIFGVSRKRLERRAKSTPSVSSVPPFQRQALDGHSVIRSQALETLEIERGHWWRPAWAAGGEER